MPFDVARLGLASAFVTGGGYKYCQLGEGNCFLRVPPGVTPAPRNHRMVRGVRERSTNAQAGAVPYAPAPPHAGATYDPTAHYRAAAVFDFFVAQGLTPERLRETSVRQVELLAREFMALDVDPAIARVENVPAERRAGFLAIRAPGAPDLVRALRQASVFADSRGQILRMGPAPYVSDDQLRAAIATLSRLIT